MRDPRWANIRIGKTRWTLGQQGCFITCLAMLEEITPDKMLKLLIKGGGLNSRGELLDYQAAALLNRSYKYTTVDPKRVCIAETHDYRRSGYPQHFFIWLGNGEIVDSLDGIRQPNKYSIASFRLFDPLEV